SGGVGRNRPQGRDWLRRTVPPRGRYQTAYRRRVGVVVRNWPVVLSAPTRGACARDRSGADGRLVPFGPQSCPQKIELFVQHQREERVWSRRAGSTGAGSDAG